MKKVSLIIAALALVLGISQCKKQEDTVSGKLITQKVTFTTSFGDGSKLGVQEASGALNLSWKKNDEVKVTDNAETPNVSILKCTSVSADGLTGTFEGTITCIEDAELTFTVGTEPNYMNQHVTAINESKIYLVGESEFIQSGDYEVDMALPYAILKVDLAELAPESGSTDVSVKIGNEEKAKVTEITESTCQVYLLLPLTVSEPTATTLTFDNDTKTITKTYTLAPNGFYTAGGTGGYAPTIPDYLCFTAGEAGSKVSLKKNISIVNLPALETSTDGKTWTGYEFSSTTGKAITLNNVGDKVYFRKANSGVENTFSTSNSKYAYFVMTGKIAASGNVMSLIDKSCETTTIPNSYCFYQLFGDCISLTTAPELPATTLASLCYKYMFKGCSSLTTAPELPATTLAESCYDEMFNGCSNLKSITVKFTEWTNTAVINTSNWVQGVFSTGKFYCPSGLPIKNGDSYIPTDWEVKTF